MQSLRWWHVAVWGTVVVLSALSLLEGLSTSRIIGSVGCAVLIGIAWSTFGSRAMALARHRVAFIVLVIVLSAGATGFASSMASIQCIAFPLIWIVLERRRDAIVGNVALAVSIGVAMFVSTGANGASFVLAGTIEGVSLAFSLSLGLWISGISEQSDERKLLIEKLEAAQSKVASLSRDAGISSERERLALEIHDTIAQDLTGLVLTAQRGLRELRGGDSEAAERQLAILEENARHALAETRSLVASGAAVGADGGLAIALERLAQRFARETGLHVDVRVDDSVAPERDAEVVLLRCAQEALANVRKHSGAGAVSMALALREGEIELTIADDGHGFDEAIESSGFGLRGMRERLGLAGGSLEIRAVRGTGTVLVASLPTSREVPA